MQLHVVPIYSTIISRLRFTKTYRVNQIVQNAKQFKRVKITATDVMKPMLALLFLNIVILTTWTVIDPLGENSIVVTLYW